MSTGFECAFREVAPGKWYYLLQNPSCPVGAFDWREHATAYGPFLTEENAIKHLHDSHANPGGWSTQEHTPGEKIDGVWQKRIDEAHARNAARRATRRW